jgi:hypothetical protein
MKKITLLCSLLLGSILINAQTETSVIQQELNAAASMEVQEPIDVQQLITNLNNRTQSPMIDEELFSLEERLALRKYYSDLNRSALADIIPSAGATETFPVAVGDNFFDPGGPGGSSTGGTPGNYPNCGCITLTTLDGATEIEFLFFSVFATFDWLRIYDSADTTGPVLYDNGTGGANAGDITLADMIASNGSATFTGTSGFLTFEFNATAVVDYGGWDVEILATAGGGGSDTVYAYDGGFCSDDFGTFDINGPYTLAPILTTTNPTWFAGDFDDMGTLYVLDQNTLSLLTVDTATGADTTVGPLTNLGAGHTVTGLAWNADNSTMYALSTDGIVSTVYTVDIATGTLTVIGDTGTTLGIWLAIDSMGNAFSADLDDNLYSIDLGTGAGTVVGPLGFNINFAQDADFDPDTDILYAGLYLGGGANEWASIDTTTGAATSLGQVNANCAELSVVALEGVVAPPTNDTCANATPINCGQTLSGDTSNDTDTNGDGSPDEWFAVTSSVVDELITVSTCDQAGYDTILTVYDACGGTVVATNDDGPGCTGFTSELSFVADGSSTYYIAVDGFGGASGTFDLSITCGPINDDPCGALPIECGVPIFGNTDTANDDTAFAPDCGTPTSASGIWYVYDDTTGLVTDILLSTCSASTNYDTKISVYTGDCSTAPLTCVAGNDDSPNCTNFQSEVEFQSDGNTTYYILVHGFGGATGDFELNMTCTPVPPPNDMIVNSIDVDEIGVPYTDPSVAMPAATLENGNPTGCNIDGAKGVWYNFTAAASGTATAEIVSPAGASFVVFFKAPDENAMETDLEYFFQVGNQCAPATSANITTEGGQAYYVFVVNDGGVTDIVIDGELLSADDNIIEGFSYYPNPTDETLNLSSVEAIEDVAIYNLLGQQVMGLDVNATSTQLDTSSLATGAYIMKVTVNGQVGTYKVIKR